MKHLKTFFSLTLAVISLSGCKNTTPTVNSYASSSNCAVQNIVPTPTATSSLGINDKNSSIESAAQSFQVPKSVAVSDVKLTLQAYSAPGQPLNGQVTLSLESDNAGTPSGSALGSAILNVSAVSTTAFTAYDFHFSSAIGLVQGVTYWLVLSGGYGVSTTNYVEWAAGPTQAPLNSGFQTLVTFIYGTNASNWQQLATPIEAGFGIGCSP